MKKGKIFFHPIEGSGPLTISWASGPKGDAVEAKKGCGVGFFSEKGELLCVIFDDVESANTHQILEFNHYHIELTVKGGRVEYTIQRRVATRFSRRRSRRKQLSK